MPPRNRLFRKVAFGATLKSAEFLVDADIDSISLNPDSVVETLKRVARAENKNKKAPKKKGTKS